MEVQHVYCVCQPGAEAALKAEVAARAPAWRFAFSRPGFVTFKLPSPTPLGSLELPPLVFARTRGASLGRVSGESMAELASGVWLLPSTEALQAEAPTPTLHVWQRETKLPGVNGIEPGPTPLASEIDQAVRSAAPAELQARLGPHRKVGDDAGPMAEDHGHENPDISVAAEKKKEENPIGGAAAQTEKQPKTILDVAIVEPNEWWVGCHFSTTRADRWPGGVPPVVLPGHAVSRAYLKMAEALRWSAMPSSEGDLWVELGCAPGGASQALLDNGMCVLGVDPAEVDPAVLDHQNFAHLRGKTSDIRRKELNDARWLAADINAAPAYTLDAAESVVTHRDAHFRGLVLTLKLPEWRLATPDKLDQYAERIRGWGFRDVRMRQLAFNRKELCLAALRSRGQRRVRR